MLKVPLIVSDRRHEQRLGTLKKIIKKFSFVLKSISTQEGNQFMLLTVPTCTVFEILLIGLFYYFVGRLF